MKLQLHHLEHVRLFLFLLINQIEVWKNKFKWQLPRSYASVCIDAAIEYCRILLDLFVKQNQINLIINDGKFNRFMNWNEKEQTLENLITLLNGVEFNSEPKSISIKQSFRDVIKIFCEESKFESKISARLILLLPMKNSVNLKDSDGSLFNIVDFFHEEFNLVANKKCKISDLEISCLYLINEEPIMIPNKKLMELEDKIEYKVEDQTSKIEELTSKSESNFIYHDCPDKTSIGYKLPTSTVLFSSLNFKFDINFVRPSYLTESIRDLAASYFVLQRIEIEGIPLRESVKSSVRNVCPAYLIAPQIIPLKTCSLQLTDDSESISFSNKDIYELEDKFDQSTLDVIKISNSLTKHFKANRIHHGRHLGIGFWNYSKTLKLQWIPSNKNMTVNSLPCSEMRKITSNFYSHQSTRSLLSSVCGGRPILFILENSKDIRTPSHMLMIQDKSIYLQTLRKHDNFSVLQIPKHLYGSENTLASLRKPGMRDLIEENFLNYSINFKNKVDSSEIQDLREIIEIGTNGMPREPFKKNENFLTKSIYKNDETYKTTLKLEVSTRIFPLLEDETLCYSSKFYETLRSLITPIRVAITRLEIKNHEIALVNENLIKLLQFTKDNDNKLFPNTRPSVVMRRELYHQLWSELSILCQEYGKLSPLHYRMAEDIISVVPQAIASINKTSVIQTDLTKDKMVVEDSKDLKRSKEYMDRDLINVRQDLIELKDLSYSNVPIENPSIPLAIPKNSENSIYSIVRNYYLLKFLSYFSTGILWLRKPIDPKEVFLD